MNNEEIIIDGVDVSGCSLYEDNPKYRMWGTCDCMRSMVDQSGYDELAGAECKGYNCYYKQLKRKEQECEELKKAYARLNSLYNDNCDFTGKLEKTLAEIKEIAYDGYNNGQTSYATFQCEKIVNIINEVEDDR